MSQSWHIPSIKDYSQQSPNDVLHVVFLQRLPKATRAQILESLANVTAEWALKFDPSGALSRPRRLSAIPWIRDSWPTAESILDLLSSQKDKYQSFVLIDSLWEASTAIAAHWIMVEDGQPKLDAVRVPMSIANVLLTLVDNGQVRGFSQVFGEATYEESKIDMYADRPLQDIGSTKELSSGQPSFLPSNLRLDRSRLDLISLLELSQEQIVALKSDIVRNSNNVKTVPPIVVHNWHGPSPSRRELRHIYDGMNARSTVRNHDSLAWFVDNILEDGDNSPRTVALAADVRSGPHSDSQSKVSLFPLRREDVLPLFNDCVKTDACYEKADERCITIEREDAVAVHHPMEFSTRDCLCPVFYLCPFNVYQERAIRAALNNEDERFAQHLPKDFAYHGYLFPPGSGNHTIEDLFDMFQKCDPCSPIFDPSYSSLRFSNYPGNFVAVDSGCLNAEDPRVGMAHVEFSWFPAPEDGAIHHIGWKYGTSRAGMAWTSFQNLWIANMGPEELFDDCKTMYLHDLKEHERDMGDEEEV